MPGRNAWHECLCRKLTADSLRAERSRAAKPAVLQERVAFNPSSMSRVCVRATNWLGDAVMSLPAIRAIRQVFQHAHIAVVARPPVADLYARETSIDQVIAYPRQERRHF